MTTYYEVLGVAESATEEELRAAYRAAARRSHPDSGGAAEAMLRLNEAWYVLQEPGRRAAYDRELAGRRRPAAPPTPTPTPSPGSGGGDETAESWSDDPTAGYDDWDTGDVGPPAVEGWLALLPPAFGAFAVALFGMAFLFGASAFLVFAVGALFISVCLFVLVALWAMLRSASPRPRPRLHREE